MKCSQISIRFHPHAIDRLKQRFPGIKKEWLRGRLRQRIYSELKKGAEPNRSGALEIEVEPGMWAVCFPSLMGGWEVMTVYPEGEEDMEEQAVYRAYGVTRDDYDWIAELEDFLSWLRQGQRECVPQGYCGQSMFITSGRAKLLKKYSSFQDAWKVFQEWKEAEKG